MCLTKCIVQLKKNTLQITLNWLAVIELKKLKKERKKSQNKQIKTKQVKNKPQIYTDVLLIFIFKFVQRMQILNYDIHIYCGLGVVVGGAIWRW